MGTTYQNLLMNGLNQIIYNLATGSRPAKDPANTAWAWFTSSDSAEPAQVDEYMDEKICSTTVTTTTYTATNNWATWSTAMNAAFANATGSVATWLETEYVEIASDLPTVPDDVIEWTKSNLPPAGGTVEVKSGAARRVGRE